MYYLDSEIPPLMDGTLQAPKPALAPLSGRSTGLCRDVSMSTLPRTSLGPSRTPVVLLSCPAALTLLGMHPPRARLFLVHIGPLSAPSCLCSNCDPNNPNVWCSLGVLYYQLHQNRDALDAYTRAIKLDPHLCEVSHGAPVFPHMIFCCI